MGIFDKQYYDITDYLEARKNSGLLKELSFIKNLEWPSGNKRNVVLARETAIELGNPSEESTAFLIWVDDPGKIKDGRISLLGPDFSECKGKSIPFGKAVIAGVKGFNEENSYTRYREMEFLRYNIDLKGYMMKAASQYQREWSRVSLDALDRGFSAEILGSALLKSFKNLEYVEACEVIFVNSSREDVSELKKISNEVIRITGAMNKMLEGLSFDCDDCEYTDVCNDVLELKKMKTSLKRKMKNNA